jgi:hypothetical protein
VRRQLARQHQRPEIRQQLEHRLQQIRRPPRHGQSAAERERRTALQEGGPGATGRPRVDPDERHTYNDRPGTETRSHRPTWSEGSANGRSSRTRLLP